MAAINTILIIVNSRDAVRPYKSSKFPDPIGQLGRLFAKNKANLRPNTPNVPLTNSMIG